MPGALEDIKIADFTWYVAGPFCTRYLADYGARIIKVESTRVVDGVRPYPPYKDNVPGVNRGGYFHNYNSNKLGVTLNMRHPKGLEIARQIIMWSDVVAESFSPGIMTSLGLGYEDISRMKPEIIMISLSSKGQTGPQARLPAVGLHLAALSGFINLTGWPDRDPSLLYGAYTDSIAGRYGAASVMAALVQRQITGKGPVHRSGAVRSRAAVSHPALAGLRRQRAGAPPERQPSPRRRSPWCVPLPGRRPLVRHRRLHR